MESKRTYGDACRFAHALDVIGERWALLIVRELLLGPKRFTDLRAGLPHASPNILAERLRGLEQGAVLRKRKLPPPAAASVYELTEWGRELEPIVTKLGAWGARSPFPPAAQEIGTDSIALALRSLFDAEAADGVEATYGLRIGEERFSVTVAGSELTLSRNGISVPAAPSTVTEVTASIAVPDAPSLAAILTGQLSFSEALGSGALQIERGSKQSVKRFLRLFPMPEPCASEGIVKKSAVAAA